MYIATHYVEGFLEEAFDCVDIIEVTKDDLRLCADGTDGMESVEVWVDSRKRGSVDEAEGRASLSES